MVCEHDTQRDIEFLTDLDTLSREHRVLVALLDLSIGKLLRADVELTAKLAFSIGSHHR